MRQLRLLERSAACESQQDRGARADLGDVQEPLKPPLSHHDHPQHGADGAMGEVAGARGLNFTRRLQAKFLEIAD